MCDLIDGDITAVAHNILMIRTKAVYKLWREVTFNMVRVQRDRRETTYNLHP